MEHEINAAAQAQIAFNALQLRTTLTPLRVDAVPNRPCFVMRELATGEIDALQREHGEPRIFGGHPRFVPFGRRYRCQDTTAWELPLRLLPEGLF